MSESAPFMRGVASVPVIMRRNLSPRRINSPDVGHRGKIIRTNQAYIGASSLKKKYILASVVLQLHLTSRFFSLALQMQAGILVKSSEPTAFSRYRSVRLRSAYSTVHFAVCRFNVINKKIHMRTLRVRLEHLRVCNAEKTVGRNAK